MKTKTKPKEQAVWLVEFRLGKNTWCVDADTTKETALVDLVWCRKAYPRTKHRIAKYVRVDP